MGFFKLCQTDDFARGLLYRDVPKYYVWNLRSDKKRGIEPRTWIRRQSGTALGRVYAVHPNNPVFYIRMLLHHVRGPTSFQDLRTVNGELCDSFKEACRRLNLLEDDTAWDSTLQVIKFYY